MDVDGPFMDEHGRAEAFYFADDLGFAVGGVDHREVLRGGAAQGHMGRGVVLAHPVPAALHFAQDHLFCEVVQKLRRIDFAEAFPFCEGQLKGRAFQVGDQDQ